VLRETKNKVSAMKHLKKRKKRDTASVVDAGEEIK
jgi:hypothetical protein